MFHTYSNANNKKSIRESKQKHELRKETYVSKQWRQKIRETFIFKAQSNFATYFFFS